MTGLELVAYLVVVAVVSGVAFKVGEYLDRRGK